MGMNQLDGRNYLRNPPPLGVGSVKPKRIPLLIVTKGNSDGSLFKGDIVHYDIDGKLVLHLPDKMGGGWMEKEDLTPAITDFEYVEHDKYEVRILADGREVILNKEG